MALQLNRRRFTVAEYDRMTEAGITEVWLFNLTAALVEVYRDPAHDGYRTVDVRRRGEWLAPLVFPGREVAVTEILG